jgi:hypothetical protein
VSDPKTPQDGFDPFDPVGAAFGALHNQNLLAAKDARIRQLEESLEAMREAGDAIWYCVRHAQRVSAEQLIEAIEEWRDARNRA